MPRNFQHAGSKPFALRLSDGVATIRDAVLLLLANFVAYIGDTWFTGGLDVELQAALVVVLFAALKFVWKYLTDTQRVQPI